MSATPASLTQEQCGECVNSGVFRAVYTVRVKAMSAMLHTTVVITAYFSCITSNMSPVKLPPRW